MAIFFAALALNAQTSGFIFSRPACVPPTTVAGIGQVRQTINYVQGPNPILMSPGGDIMMLSDVGQCCWDNYWEGVFTLKSTASGSGNQFYPIWGSGNFGNDSTRNENATAGYPSGLFSGSQWQIAYTSGFNCLASQDPNCTGLYGFGARISVPSLTTQAAPSQVTNKWITPENANCQVVGSCPCPIPPMGCEPIALNGLSFITHPDGQLYAYHGDNSVPACTSAWTRHLVNPDMSVPHLGGDGCLTFVNAPKNPKYVDIARGADGALYMLTDGMPDGKLVEWKSVAEPGYALGLLWRQTGMQKFPPAGPVPGYPGDTYAVFDGAYLKDPTGLMIQPKVIVAQISHTGSNKPPYVGEPLDGIGYLFDPSQGTWYYYYWADAGAYLPPGFGTVPPLATAPASFPPGDSLWLEDDLPSGAQMNRQSGSPLIDTFFIWDRQQFASGVQSHTHNGSSGTRQHVFFNATQTLTVQQSDRLVAYVLLNPCNPPTEIMLQWKVGNGANQWEHRAFWGQDQIPWGVTGTASRYSMGAIPPTSVWYRLEVSPSVVGLVGQAIDGMAFTTYNGQAWFDHVGKTLPPTVTSVTPAFAAQKATSYGSALSLGGSAFQTGASVQIIAVSTSIQSVTPTSIAFTATVPAYSAGTAPGSRDVSVTNPNGQVGTLVSGFDLRRFVDEVGTDSLAIWSWKVSTAHAVMSDVVTSGTFGITTNGDGTQMFNPTQLVRRRDMARFIVRARGEAQASNCSSPTRFADVPCTDPDWGWIEKFAADGISQGCATGFCPDNNNTRGEMAVFIEKGLNHTGSTTLCDAGHPPHFSDVPCTHIYWKWIQELFEDGITSGCGQTTFCPDNSVMRSEMAKFIGKAWNY